MAMIDFKGQRVSFIAMAVIVVIAWFLFSSRFRNVAMPDMGAGQGIRFDYGGESSASETDVSNLPFIPRMQYTNPQEQPPKQPVIYQEGRRVPIYQFYNEMFHSEEPAYLQERAFP